MAGGDQQCANDADTELTMAAGGILGVVLSKKKSGDVRCRAGQSTRALARKL